jgi:PAS domain-containing protein
MERLLREKKTVGNHEGSPIPTFVIDRDHRIILWNKDLCRSDGLEQADMIGTDKPYIPPFLWPGQSDRGLPTLIVDQSYAGTRASFYVQERKFAVQTGGGAFEARDYL